MTSERVERYLDTVRRLLTVRGIRNSRFLDEAGAHLVDAVEAGVRRGLLLEAAEEEALAKFGPPDLVKIVEPARLPERPVGPTRAHVNIAGTLAGLAIGSLLIILKRPVQD